MPVSGSNDEEVKEWGNWEIIKYIKREKSNIDGNCKAIIAKDKWRETTDYDTKLRKA